MLAIYPEQVHERHHYSTRQLQAPTEYLLGHILTLRSTQKVSSFMAVQYGLLVPQGWRMDLVGIADPVEAYETMTRVALEAEALGFASTWLYDHFHTVPTPTQEVTFECWTSTAALARDTRSVRIGQNEQEYRAYGYDYPAAPERLRHLREAVQVILAMWTQNEAVFEGKYYHINGAINQPKGVQKPHIPMLIGGGGERVTLKLVAQYGDACNIGHLDNAGLEHKFAVLKQHCEDIGRDYNTIKRTVLFNCAIAETDDAAMAKAASFTRNIPSGRLREQALIGTPDTIRRRLAEIEEAGAQEIILFMPDSKDLASVRLFAHECMQR
jgi:alkanesulfonate monooxygenase SsuD/methylene tetrahydromethanopterin reductase-like flavin-dependent oxidoreductase (luciferase family)